MDRRVFAPEEQAAIDAIMRALEIVLAVLIGLLINQQSVWTSRVTRILILLPYAIPPIANGLIWSFIYSFQFGFLNRILFSLGLISDPVNWAGNPDTALYAVTVPYIWRTLPFAIILVHAALQGIPRELYEQAAIDGANAWHRFTKITWPMLQQIIAIILILRMAFAFAVFEEILAITQGGPGDATWVAAWYSYKITFAPPNNFGMGSASAFILTLMIAAIAPARRARVGIVLSVCIVTSISRTLPAKLLTQSSAHSCHFCNRRLSSRQCAAAKALASIS